LRSREEGKQNAYRWEWGGGKEEDGITPPKEAGGRKEARIKGVIGLAWRGRSFRKTCIERLKRKAW